MVNEPLNGDGSFVSDVFYQAMGSGYIADALRTAHAADPHEAVPQRLQHRGHQHEERRHVQPGQVLKEQGVPINGVGLESHFILGTVPSTMLANMRRFAALGVDVAVTELDDRIQLPATAAT